MKNKLTNQSIYAEREREREREYLQNERRKLLFNFFLNLQGGEGYLIPDISLEVLGYE